ncbi:UNVERIFIED_CONTAM: hypothetical protein HDU68_003900, partial [Siphonaria sp. JEL0065]
MASPRDINPFTRTSLKDERGGSEDLLDALSDFEEDPTDSIQISDPHSKVHQHANHKALEEQIKSHPLNSISLTDYYLKRDNGSVNFLIQTIATTSNADGNPDDSFQEDSGSETLAGTPASSWCDTRSTSRSQMIKRYQPSPTPSNASSSNASVIASEEEEEGFEDVDFPAQIGDLHFVGDNGADASAEPRLVHLQDGIKELAEKMAKFADAEDVEDDLSSGFSVPEDFNWDKPALKERHEGAFTTSAVTANSKPSLSVGSELDSLSPPPVHCPTPPTTKTTGKSMIMSKPLRATDFGDGTELDGFDDMSETDTCSISEPSQAPPPHPIPLKAWAEQPESQPNSPVISISQIPVIKHVSLINHVKPKPEVSRKSGAVAPTRPALSGLLGSSLRRSDTNLNRWTNPTPPVPKKQKKKPTLIRNVNPADIAHVVGKMVYDPIQQKWTGNEESLLDFDKDSTGAGQSAPPTPQKPRTRPALIANKSGLSQIPHVVGSMVFDPVKMCWVGNEEDIDVFAGLEDAGFPVTEADQDAQKYFTLTKTMKQSLYVAESQHKLFIGKWYPKAVQEAKTLTRDTSKSHLYDIRA